MLSESSSGLPSRDQATAIHQRLLAGDRVASADLADAYFAWLAAWLARVNRGAEPHQCDTAAGDAILDLIKRPEAYDPARLGLEAYLRMAAKRDLQNLWSRERRHRQRRVDLAAVEVSPDAGKYLADEDDNPARIAERREEDMANASRLAPRLASAADGLTAGEARALELLRQGERKTGPYAVALGIGHLPVAAQRQQVKRVKDKLKKRLERAGGPDG
jgi:DNA-directed RNA polymerase specialized sigma24 family protein